MLRYGPYLKLWLAEKNLIYLLIGDAVLFSYFLPKAITLFSGPKLLPKMACAVALLLVLSCVVNGDSIPNQHKFDNSLLPGSHNELSGILLPYYLLIKDSFAKKINNKQLVKSLAKQKFKSFINNGLDKLCITSPQNQMCSKVIYSTKPKHINGSDLLS